MWLGRRCPRLRIEVQFFRLVREDGTVRQYSGLKELGGYIEDRKVVERRRGGTGRHRDLVEFIGGV